MRNKDTGHGPNWKGGRVKIGKPAYWYIFQPDHPNATQMGYVAEHRLVMEAHLGRYLLPDEEVHHISKDRNDNDLSNLELLTASEHARLHRTDAVVSDETRAKLSTAANRQWADPESRARWYESRWGKRR